MDPNLGALVFFGTITAVLGVVVGLDWWARRKERQERQRRVWLP